MIPAKVSLKNFLCYRTPAKTPAVEFDFDGSRLWSISGDNGAGKSAIFDAINYALYGSHRDGKQDDRRLISTGANDSEITFEFRVDGRLYRVHRTIGRPATAGGQDRKSRQAAYFDQVVGDWRPIAGTHTDGGFNDWVQKTLKMGPETFLASVLLQQGQSDRLVQAKAGDRFEILSGLLDLTVYRQIEERAKSHAADYRKEVQRLDAQLAGQPRVTDEDVNAGEGAARRLKTELSAASEAATQSALVLEGARQHTRLVLDLESAKRDLAAVEGLLADADQIREEAAEWRTLSASVPALRGALADLAAAAARGEEADEAKQTADAIDVTMLEEQARQTIQREAEAAAHAKEAQDTYEALAQARGPLHAVLACRESVAQRERAVIDAGDPAKCDEEVERLRVIRVTADDDRQKAEGEHATRVERAGAAREALKQAKEQLATREQAKDEALCSRCGQQITPEHAATEIVAARADVASAETQLSAATQELAYWTKEVTRARTADQDASGQLTRAEAALATARIAQTEHQRASEALGGALTAAAGAPAVYLRSVAASPIEEARTRARALESDASALRQERDEATKAVEQARSMLREAERARREAVDQRQALLQTAALREQAAEGLRTQAEIRLTGVDAAWRRRVFDRDDAFVDGLARRLSELSEAPERHVRLEEAQSEKVRLTERVRGVEQELSVVPPAHRVAVASAEDTYGLAEQAAREARDAWGAAEREVQKLREQQNQRALLAAQSAKASRARSLYARLADLLGRGGLQGILLDDAVVGIAALANETLHRISGGNLQIEMERQRAGAGGEDLVIRSRDLASSAEPLDVKFISGSQKFRTSVALAAAIGQYTRRGSTERALIIDEGFGSLDLRGRTEMISELRTLSQVMDRLIVVSHQEDFQDRTLFPTGFVLTKVGQRTEVERFV